MDITEQCKEKYPIGTIVESLGGSGHQKITSHNFFFVKENYVRASDDCLIYKEGRFAKIIRPVIKFKYIFY